MCLDSKTVLLSDVGGSLLTPYDACVVSLPMKVYLHFFTIDNGDFYAVVQLYGGGLYASLIP